MQAINFCTDNKSPDVSHQGFFLLIQKSTVVDRLRIQVMMRQAVPRNLLPLCPRHAVIAVGINRNAAAGQEFAPDLDIGGLHQFDEVVHDDVHAVLVEITVIAEAEQI